MRVTLWKAEQAVFRAPGSHSADKLKASVMADAKHIFLKSMARSSTSTQCRYDNQIIASHVILRINRIPMIIKLKKKTPKAKEKENGKKNAGI
jgi:hypothetical protein